MELDDNVGLKVGQAELEGLTTKIFCLNILIWRILLKLIRGIFLGNYIEWDANKQTVLLLMILVLNFSNHLNTYEDVQFGRYAREWHT